eukprot:737475-Rhodomonas_salina.1
MRPYLRTAGHRLGANKASADPGSFAMHDFFFPEGRFKSSRRSRPGHCPPPQFESGTRVVLSWRPGRNLEFGLYPPV